MHINIDKMTEEFKSFPVLVKLTLFGYNQSPLITIGADEFSKINLESGKVTVNRDITLEELSLLDYLGEIIEDCMLPS